MPEAPACIQPVTIVAIIPKTIVERDYRGAIRLE
jgi:hypothetical protein